MKITDIAEDRPVKRDSDPSNGVYIGFVDESHVGMHIYPRWDATDNGEYAAQQADQIASDQYEDIVVLKFRVGFAGFSEHYRAKAGRDINAEIAAHKDEDDKYPMSDNMDQLSKQGR